MNTGDNMSFIKLYTNKVEMSMEMWKKTHNKLMPLEPKFRILCPICFINKFIDCVLDGMDLLNSVREAMKYSSDIAFKSRNVFSPDKGQYRIDMIYKCMKCDMPITFGVHIDKDYFDEIGEGTLHVPYMGVIQ